MDAVRRTLSCALVATSLLSACATAPRTRPAPVERHCGPEIAGMEEVFDPGAFVLLGEMHGTNEIPYVVGELACQLAGAGEPVTVAVEISAAEQPLLDRYLDSQGTAEDQLRLFSGTFWNRPYQDGRSSKAMAAMIERLRALRAQRLPIRVIAFDVPGLTGNAHEELTAEVLLADRTEHPRHTYLVLCGNVHARTVQGVDWDPDLIPMGLRLLAREPGLRSLDAEYAPGHAWTCKLAQPIDCGVASIAAPRRKNRRGLPPPVASNQHLIGTQPAPGAVYDPAPSFRGYRPFVRLSSASSEEGFHGIFYVGPITASPPATAASLGAG